MRAVLQVFENYQKARVNFVQTVAELATRPQNIEALQNAGVMQLLRPLLLDNVPSIQQSAALALGRLANYNDELAEAVVSNEVLPQLVYSLSEQNRFYKKAAAFVLRAVAKHSPQLAQVRDSRQARGPLRGRRSLSGFGGRGGRGVGRGTGERALQGPAMRRPYLQSGTTQDRCFACPAHCTPFARSCRRWSTLARSTRSLAAWRSSIRE